MQDRIAFLTADLPHLFDDTGIDKAAYADNVRFLDPITRYSSLSGYLFNIAALRRVFSPTFVLLGARQTAPRTVTTRWAMTMVAAPLVPLLGGRAPSLAFTGTSIMAVDASGRFCSHADTWDAIEDQAYFSVEGAAHVAAQLADLRRAPGGLWTPPYGLLRKQKGGLEVRAYEGFDVMEARWVGDGGCKTGGGDMAARVALFRALAGVLQSTGAAMTTPVLTDTSRSTSALALEGSSAGTMRFALSPADAGRVRAALEAGSVSLPPGIQVSVITLPPATVAALPLDGREPAAAAAELRARLAADFGPGGAVVEPGTSFTTARYNSPATLPRFRKEEVLLPLQAFDVWA